MQPHWSQKCLLHKAFALLCPPGILTFLCQMTLLHFRSVVVGAFVPDMLVCKMKVTNSLGLVQQHSMYLVCLGICII